MAKRKRLQKKKKKLIIAISIALAFVTLLIAGCFMLNNVNNVRIVFITSGFAPESEEIIDTVHKDIKDYRIRDIGIIVKEFKSDSVIIERDGETKVVRYNTDIWVSGQTGCDLKTKLCIDAPVYYVRFEK